MPISRFVLAASAVAVAGGLLTPTPATAVINRVSSLTSSSISSAVDYGVYAGAGSNGVAGAAEWSTFSGHKTTHVIDFLADESFAAITNTGWLLGAYQGKGLHLDLGIPMLPKDNSGSLTQCAAGAYNAQWKKIGTDLVSYGQADATLRVGWEMNGNWYKWRAAQNPTAWVGCYQQIVKSTRAAAGQRFSYAWTVNVGINETAAETVYPGDAYVDYVGVNTYDMNWNYYPIPSGMSVAAARANAWKDLKSGNHGLDYWVSFSKSHGKKLAIPEWGVVSRGDNHGGLDNPDYVNSMFDYIANPANNIAYACYFNDNNSVNSHKLTGATAFPKAAAAVKAKFFTGATTPSTTTPTTSPIPAPTTNTTTGPAKRATTLLAGSARGFARTALK